MSNSILLPRTVEGVTPEWLSNVLQDRCPGIVIESVKFEQIISGTTTKILARVIPRNSTGLGPLPERICIKGEFDQKLREKFESVKITGTQIEAEFYSDLAPLLKVPTLDYWYAGSEPGMGILILDDLSGSGCAFGDPTDPWPADRVEMGLRVLASLHSSTWKQKFPQFKWLNIGSAAVEEFARVLFSEEHWEQHFQNPDIFQLPPELTDRQRIWKAMQRLWTYNRSKADFVVHGDAHIGNTYIDSTGKPFFLDWAGPSYSCWAADVAYFVTGAMTSAQRRESERELLKSYLHSLHSGGGPKINWDEAWSDYCRFQLHGIFWATLPSTMQSNANCHAMGDRHTQAIIDLDTLKLLDS